MDPLKQNTPTPAEKQMFQMVKKGLEDIATGIKEQKKLALEGAEKIIVQGKPGEQGPPGETPIKGKHYFTKEEQASFVSDIMSRIRIPEDGKPGEDAVVDYSKIEKFIAKEVGKIPRPKPGIPGKPGKDAIVDYDSIITTVLSKIPATDLDPIMKHVTKEVTRVFESRPVRTFNSAGPTTRISELVDVNVEGVTTNQVLGWDGTQWTAMNQSGGGGGISDGDKGDITVSSSGTVWTIDNGVVTEAKLNSSVNASLDLADSALQVGDNVSDLFNDMGYLFNGSNISELANDVGYLVPGDNISNLFNDTGYLTTVEIADINASGTPTASTFLRGDGSWQAITSSQWVTTGSDIYYNTGKVGVGVTAPATVFEIGGSQPALRINDTRNSTFPDNEKFGSIEFYSSDTTIGAKVAASICHISDPGGTHGAPVGTLQFNVSGNSGAVFEAMRINSAGLVGIGGISAPDTSYAVQVKGGFRVDDGRPGFGLNIGADVNQNTRSTNVRKLGSISGPDFANTRRIEFLTIDSDSSTTNRLYIGGRPGGSAFAATQLYLSTQSSISATGGITGLMVDSNQRVGIGNSAPAGQLHITSTGSDTPLIITKTAETGVRERLLTATVTDDATTSFFINNGTISAGAFAPVFGGYTASTTLWPLGFDGFVPSSADASDSSSFGLIDFALFRTTSASDPLNGTLSNIVNRKLFTVRNNATIAMTVNASGNLGINTSTPYSKLDVNGLIPTPSLPNTVALFSDNVNNISGVEMRNTNTGASAEFRFAVYDTSNNYIAFTVPSTGNTSLLFGRTRSTFASVFVAGANNRALVLGTVTSGDLVLGTNNLERVTVAGSTGNVGIGTTSFTDGVKLLAIGNATTVPTTNPTAGGVIYVEAGALKYRGSSGTITVLGSA